MTSRNDKKFHLLQLNPTTKKMEAKTNKSSNINMPVVDKIKQLKRNLNNKNQKDTIKKLNKLYFQVTLLLNFQKQLQH